MLAVVLNACQQQEPLPTDERQSLEIEGLIAPETNSAGIAPTVSYSLLMTAKLGSSNYIQNVPSTMAANTGKITFNSGAWFYPINHSTLQFYAFTPPVTGTQTGDVMSLTAGRALANDALLSNNGGGGTSGSSTAQITQMEFSHVMTKLDVTINVTDAQLGSWQPSTFWFTMANVYATGSYPITSLPGASAGSLSGSYQIKLGTNYLIPSGNTLATTLTGLTIDNYQATSADLTKFAITTTNGGPLVLNPGSAYTLTFNINRLQLQSIVLSLGNWNNVNINNGNVVFTPQNLNLDLGAYTADDIVKVVVTDNSGNLFTGSVSGGVATFVLAPQNAAKIELYTATGLLLTTNTNASINGTTLLVTGMNACGMLPVNPQAAYDALTNPYAVSTKEQFRKISTTPTCNYRQVDNLNMGNISMPSVGMSGSYDGNGYQINNINISGSGLFATVAAGQVLQNVNVASGAVMQSTANNYVGGLCGTNMGTIVGCVNNAQVSSTLPQYMGGICGLNKGQIIACLNTGDLVGVYASGSYIGGICGYNQYTADVAITSSVSIGMLSATGTSQPGVLAGICGYSVAGGLFKTSYWLTGTAASTIGGSQVAINGVAGSFTATDLADLSQQRMRETNTLNNLNASIPGAWSTYRFTMSQVTWPTPSEV